MEHKLEIAGKTFFVNLENLAEQANGAVFVRHNDTLVMATATMGYKDTDQDFFPLTVDFEEKFYAAGKILGSRFVRREGKPSDEAILTGRFIDRAIRPLFPKSLKREVQVIIGCYSFDEENDPDMAGMIAASLALGISDIPWDGPVAPIRISKVNGNLIVNPTYKEREEAIYDLAFSATEENGEIGFNMIEGQGNEIQEQDVLEALEISKNDLRKILDFQKEIVQKYGKAKTIIPEKNISEELKNAVGKYRGEMEDAMFKAPSVENKSAMQDLQDKILTEIQDNFGAENISTAKDLIEEELENLFNLNVIEKEKRPDGRNFDQIRPLEMRVNILPRTHGSGLFIRGKTKALSNVTLGSPSDQKLVEGMEIRGKKRFMHHYNFPPFCSGEIKPLRGPGRREIGHGMLAEKALFPLVPNFENFPYTIRIVTEILSSNGSTSMASVSASTLALMDAGVPISKPAAGISVGLAKEKNKYRLLCDIQGPEDHYGDMDFKVAGTRDGITAIQMDIKTRSISTEIAKEALEIAKKARHQILDLTEKTIAAPRENVSQYAPKIFRISINPDKIGSVIGPGGRIINEIIDKCEVAIDIEEDGNVFVSSASNESAQKAIEWIKNITREIKVGEVFQGKVARILDFGAIVQILPDKDGMVHISQLAPYRVNKVEDIVKVGQVIPVKVISVDESGKIGLSLKEITHPGSNDNFKQDHRKKDFSEHKQKPGFFRKRQ